jgi:choline dehydrogenase-like flavoprotein
MLTALIVGSGPAAAGAALALAQRPDLEITVLDLGLQLDDDRRSAVRELGATDEAKWPAHRVDLVSKQPVGSEPGGLPEKRAYGSDFAFRDVGQLAHLSVQPGVNHKMVSAAYGGFSNVWGTQIMPFTSGTFESWPIKATAMERHYRAVLDHVPFAAEDDDLAELFPLISSPTALPAASSRTGRVLSAYGRHRHHLNRLGVTVGKARLAFESSACTRCGMCMTGCPYGLMYSASHTFDDLRRTRRIVYHGGLLALEVGETGDRPYVIAKELATGRLQRFEADRLFVACGALGTTRLVANSLRHFDDEMTMGESAQFVLPFVSRSAVPDPRSERQFTLNQFNMIVALDGAGIDVSQLHFYTYNPAFLDALPWPLSRPAARPVTDQLLRRVGVALGYLPSWASPRLFVRVRPHPTDVRGALPQLSIRREDVEWRKNPMLRSVLWRVLRSGPALDLYPVVPMLQLAGGGRSYHWGGSFPHRDHPAATLSSDTVGRVGGWRRIHLVDASVFPNVPATTFTLSIMANAHRIAAASFETDR